MEISDYLGLINSWYETTQTLWTIYVTVCLGVLAFLAAVPKEAPSRLVRVGLLAAFLLFATMNLHGLERTRGQLATLCEAATTQVEREMATDPESAELLDLIRTSHPGTAKGLMRAHRAFDTLVVLGILTLPGYFIRLRRLRALLEEERPLSRGVGTVLVSWDQLTGEWVLGAEYSVDVRGGTVVVPEGFRFDLASVPRLLWPVVGPFELSIAAPLVHDFIYRGGSLEIEGRDTRSQQVADGAFLDLMLAEGVSRPRARLAHAVVAVFGALFYQDSPDSTAKPTASSA